MAASATGAAVGCDKVRVQPQQPEQKSMTMSPSLSLSDLTSDQVEHYLALQEDPIVGESSGRWVISHSNGDAGDHIWVVRLRGREGFEVLVPQTDWETLGDVEPQSQALFKYSAGFLPRLLTESGSVELVEETLAALLNYLQSSAWKERASWMTSLDHAVAMRLRTMATLACRFRRSGVEVPSALFAIVGHDVQEVMGNRERYLPQNNHGAMVCISLIHVSAIFTFASTAEVQRVAWDALKRITDDMFDECGVAGENSPAYQAYWLRLLEPLLAMVQAWPLANLVLS